MSSHNKLMDSNNGTKKGQGYPIRAGVGYTIGNYLVKGIGILSVPIFARLLSQEDYGIYNTFVAYESILYILIGLALHSSLKNAYVKFGERFEEYVSSIILLPIINGFVLGLLSWTFRVRISEWTHLNSGIMLWLVIHSFCSGIVIFYSFRTAIDYNYSDYIRVSILNAGGNILLSVILIFTFFTKDRYMGRIVGSTVSFAITSLFIIISFFKTKRPVLEKCFFTYGLKLSLPIIPHGLAQLLLLHFDRIMINSCIGSKEAGTYGFAYSIYSFVQITMNSFGTVYEPWFFKEMNSDENNRGKICNVGNCMAVFLMVLIAFLMLLSPEIIYILGGKKYLDSIYCLIPVLFAGFFAMSYMIPAVAEYYYEKTKYIAICTGIAAAMNITLNATFIPRYGYIAAAYTTLISYIIYFILHTIISKSLFGDYILDLKVTIVCSMILGGISVEVLLLGNALWIRIISLAVIIVGCYTYFNHKIGKEFIKDVIKQVINK